MDKEMVMEAILLLIGGKLCSVGVSVAEVPEHRLCVCVRAYVGVIPYCVRYIRKEVASINTLLLQCFFGQIDFSR